MAESYNFYDLLGVSTTASLEEISVAYRRNVAKYHPDINAAPNAQVLLTMLNEAWETLRDPVRRAGYDRAMRSSAGSSSRESPTADESAAQRSEAKRREQQVREAQRRAAESERVARVERQKRLILERTVQERKRMPTFVGIIVVAFLLLGLAAILVQNHSQGTNDQPTALPTLRAFVPRPLIRTPLPKLVTAPATAAAMVECADLTISDVADYGALVSTSDGRSYTVADQGLMRIYARNWSPGDSVTVCRSGISASIANAAQSTKVQATERH